MSNEVQIKGTRNGLVILLPSGSDFEDLKATLAQKMEAAKGFFRGAKFAIHQETASIAAHQQQELEQLLAGYGLVPAGDIQPPHRRPSKSKTAKLAVSGDRVDKTISYSERTHVVWHSLRSGQQARNDLGHLVIMGDVHSGALAEAGGHVLIMGRCAGTVRAGLHGNKQAQVTSLDFRGAVICIAEAHIFTDDPGYAPGRGPHRAFLHEDKIAFSPML